MKSDLICYSVCVLQLPLVFFALPALRQNIRIYEILDCSAAAWYSVALKIQSIRPDYHLLA